MKNCPQNIFSLIIKVLLNKIILVDLLMNRITIKCENECDIEEPIYKKSSNNCILEYCTKEQFDNEECIISNEIIKKQWLNNVIIMSKSNNPIYPSIGTGTNNDLLFESTNDKNEKIFYSLEEEGRGYLDESQLNSIKINTPNNMFNTYGNSLLFTINEHKCLLKLSFYESIEIYDLVDKKYTNYNLKNILGNNIKSYYNSLLRTNEENVFIYTYITSGNYLAMQKFKIKSNNELYTIEIIKTSIENEKTISKNSRRCLITNNQYIECLDMDEEQTFYIRLYDINLNFINKFKLEKNNSPPERAFYTYHEAVLIKNEISIFVYFTDISNNKAKPIVTIRKLESNNLLYLTDQITQFTLFTNESFISYYFSDTENSFTNLNDHYFALATLTTYTNRRLIIALFNLFNSDKTLRIHYFNIPLKDLYDIDYHSNLFAFYYNYYIGIQFVQLKNNVDYLYTSLLFSYANSTDPPTVKNIFEKYDNKDNIFTINLTEYIDLQNNIFCYVLTGIKILSVPSPDTNIIISTTNSDTQIKANDVISLNENITVSYSTNLENVVKGNYFIAFEPTLEEPGEEDFSNCQFCLYDYLGEIIKVNWSPDKFTGRKTKFEFTVGNCYKNCATCIDEGISADDQKCESCLEGFYFEENTKNCFKSPNEKYYFNKNKKVFSKCYKDCKTCSDINSGENIHNCLSCKENYLLYDNSNCLSCKHNNLFTNYEQTSCLQTIPLGYYLSNSEYNTIDKCHTNCLSCNEGPKDDNMNCLYCDNENDFYLLENTKNCYKLPYEGYYLDEDYKIKKCYSACKTCSSGPTRNSKGEIENMNCDSCNNELGYYKTDSNSKNCEFKERFGEYYDASDNNYYPCYRACLTCFNKEDSNYKMNCLTCNENNGYFLYTKNGNNCLNCKINGRYINFDENECTDVIPQGYYIKNNLYNQIDSCYPKCKTCSEKGISDNDMKCDSCPENFFLENKNCVNENTCPNKFYYKINIDESLYLKEKKCLDNNNKNNCPNMLPFYYTHTKECIDFCPIEFLFTKGCKIANFEKGLNRLLYFIEIEYAKGNLNYFNKIFEFSDNFQNYLMKINISSFIYDDSYSSGNIRRLSEESEIIQNIDNDENYILDKNDFFEEAEIDLDECLKILEENSIIDNSTILTLIKIDLKIANLSKNNFYFELFNDNNRLKRIDLSICFENNLTIKLNIDKELKKHILNNVNNNTYNISNMTNNDIKNIYNDQCYVFISKDGTDVLIEDRIIDYGPNSDYFSNSTYDNISDLDYSDISSDSIFEPNYDFDTNSTSEIGNIFCPTDCSLIEVDFNLKSILCSCIYNDDINNNINIELPKKETEIKNKKIEINFNEKRNMKSVSYSNSVSNIYVLKCIKNISIYFSKNYILIIFTILYGSYIIIALIYFIKDRKKYMKEVEKNIKIKSKISFKLSNPPKNKNGRNSNLKIMDLNSEIRSNQNFQDNIKFKNNMNILQKTITLPSDETNITITNEDLDLVDYNVAINKDKRSFIELFLSISQKRLIFIFSFKKDHNIKVLKISLIIFCLIKYFMVNLFFFNNNVIHKIYIDKGKYNLGYQIKYVFLSALISCIFLYIAKYIFTFKKSPKQLIQIIKCIDASLIILIILFSFYWIYIGSFCSVFIKTQKHLIINFVLAIIVCIIYEVIITIISLILRKIALKKKKLPKLYSISRLLISLK